MLTAQEAKAPFFVGVDVGGTSIKIGIVDDYGRSIDSGEIDCNGIHRSFVSIKTEPHPQTAAGLISETIHDLLRRLHIEGELCHGVGLGIPGTMDSVSRKLRQLPNLQSWQDYPLVDELSKVSGFPVLFCNDANAAAYGEYWVGSASGKPSMALLTLGTGIGCGIILGGRAVVGTDGFGGECGHLVIDCVDDAVICGCGQRGHLEAYASATAVARRTMSLTDRRESSIRPKITPERLASKDHDTLKKCLAVGVLPDILKRGDITLEVVKMPDVTQYLNRGTGEIVSFTEMVEAGGQDREKVDIHRDPPIQSYFERNLDTGTVVCPMGQTLFYFGPGRPGGKKRLDLRRYHRVTTCAKCPNKCTTAKQRVVTFHPDETRVYTNFYDDCAKGVVTRKSNHTFVKIDLQPEEKGKNQKVVMRYCPNRRRLRMRGQVVEHPFGTVKRWNDGYYLLVKGRIKAAAEIALSFLGYNFKRVLNLLGTEKMMNMVRA